MGGTCIGRSTRSKRHAWLLLLVIGYGLTARDSTVAEFRQAATGGTHSPIHLFGLMNRQRPYPLTETWFTDAELDVIANRFEMIAGPDGHSYEFPGAIGDIRAINPHITALTHWEAMGVQPSGDRMASLDVDETIFIHSADPASLVVVAHNGHTVLWFRQDARNRDQHESYTPPGVEAYLVEVSTPEDERFRPLGYPILDDGTFLHRVEDDGPNEGCIYRVRTRLVGGDVVDYSWPASVNLDAARTLAAGVMHPLEGTMSVLCYGDCPEAAGDLRCEADLDNDHVYDEDEQFPFSSVQPYGDGARLYTGTVTADAEDLRMLYGYRFVVSDSPEDTDPPSGSYQSGFYNNRIQMRFVTSYLVWPDRPEWIALATERMTDALEAGYDGMRLDFVLDTLDQHWAATGLLPDWGGEDDPRIADAMHAFLTALSQHEPRALLSFNGRFVAKHADNYASYLTHADCGEVEFFAIGNDRHSTILQENTADAVAGVWEARAAGHETALFSGAALDNTVGRLKALAIYLLIMDDDVYFYNETDPATQDVVYLPEWDVPLGEPLQTVSNWWDMLDERHVRLLSRQFESGWVYYNDNTEPVTIALGRKRYRLSVTGGLSTRVGGDGKAIYKAVGTLTLPPAAAAILVNAPPKVKHVATSRR